MRSRVFQKLKIVKNSLLANIHLKGYFDNLISSRETWTTVSFEEQIMSKDK